ncbi:sulfite exporter TauE/SafE family protein [Nitratireductor soli]|uniref:sulfite exporter TauE/SafE family protein n=1 Tax=Nitratireductor soli TaxID=1670619 RepID=UPI00065E6ECA|nr:sulfite exporter TauE/SafE family protein [Nitratireductor soli]
MLTASFHSIADWGLLTAAAFAAGVLNAVAGGGSFLTFPALVYAGVPPVIANATSAFAVTPGYVGGAIGFRKELKTLDTGMLLRICAAGIAGGIIGGLLLTITPASMFNAIVPGLLLLATAIFALGERMVPLMRGGGIPPSLGVFVVSIYGGYFNGGLGIVLLALFALLGMTSLPQMNGLKNLLSFFLSCASLVVFALGDLIDWPPAALMAVFAIAGGFAGASVSRKIPKSLLQTGIVVTGLAMSCVFFYRLF